MGVREMLTEIEENQGRRCTITLTVEDGMRGGAELSVENCRCVRSCDDNFIVLAVRGMDIRVTGTPLQLDNFGAGNVRVKGEIHSLTFEKT